jgi:16S rRNA processing protein RimM
MPGRIAVGIIRKAHGVRGEANVEPWTDSLERFNELDAVTLVSPGEDEARQTRIESARAHAGRALLKFEGIDTPDDLRAVRNWTVEIPLEQARKLEANEYFLHDLVGLTLVDRDGRARGTVKEVYEGGGGLLLNVDGPHGEYEVPFASEICAEIDLGEKRILVDLPEGLDDLKHVED